MAKLGTVKARWARAMFAVLLLLLHSARASEPQHSHVNVDLVHQILPADIWLDDMLAWMLHQVDARSWFGLLLNQLRNGSRDRYVLPASYRIQSKSSFKHYDDRGYRNGFQYDVYSFAKVLIMRLVAGSAGMQQSSEERLGQLPIIYDIGTGGGFKLVSLFPSTHFRTVGFEVEPALSWLHTKYPDRDWRDALRNQLVSEDDVIQQHGGMGSCLVICADVIEHIPDPDELLSKLWEIPCDLFVMSTPTRPFKHGGPPTNPSHIREWTFFEFKLYLQTWRPPMSTSSGRPKHAGWFEVLRSFVNVQHMATQFHVLTRVPGIS